MLSEVKGSLCLQLLIKHQRKPVQKVFLSDDKETLLTRGLLKRNLSN